VGELKQKFEEELDTGLASPALRRQLEDKGVSLPPVSSCQCWRRGIVGW
jgi:hypothetical protein